MAKSEDYRLILNYNDGSREQFRLPHQVDKTKIAGFLERLLSSGVVSLQLEGRLLVVPTVNLRSAELVPAPDKLPEVVLHNVKRLSQA